MPTIAEVKNHLTGTGGAASANSAMVISSTTPQGLTTCSNDDYATSTTPVELGRSDTQSTMSVSAWATTTLNANGRAYIKKGNTGRTWFRTLYGWDFDNLIPHTNGITWSSAGLQAIEAYFSDTATVGVRPYLAVTHSAPAPSTFVIPRQDMIIFGEFD